MTALTNYDILLRDQKHEREEQAKVRRNSILITVGIMLVLGLITFLIWVPEQDPPYVESEGAIGVLLGNTDDAIGTELGPVKAGSEGAAQANVTPPPPTPPVEQPAIQTTNDPESAPVDVPDTKRPAQPQHTQQTVVQPTTSNVKTDAKPAPKFKPNPAAAFTASDGSSSHSGEGGHNGLGGDLDHSGLGGTHDGQMGTPGGNNPYGGGGTGTSGLSINRKCLNYHTRSVSYSKRGKVIIAFSIDKQGNVLEAHLAPGSTIIDQDVVDQVVSLVKEWKFESNTAAPAVEKGTYVKEITLQ